MGGRGRQTGQQQPLTPWVDSTTYPERQDHALVVDLAQRAVCLPPHIAQIVCTYPGSHHPSGTTPPYPVPPWNLCGCDPIEWGLF